MIRDKPDTQTGDLNGAGLHIGIVVSRWNADITEKMLEGALDALTSNGVGENSIKVARVPGAWEIPVIVSRFAKSGRFDAVVAIGCLIKGETPHFEYLSSEVTRGLGQIALESGVPVTYGVITVLNLDQAVERAGSNEGNKGAEAAIAAIEMANLVKTLANL